MPKPITARQVPEQQQRIFDSLPPNSHPTDRLAVLNRLTLFAHGQLCGQLLTWTAPTAFKRVIRAVLEIKERTPDIGEPPCVARFTLFALKKAYYVIRASKPGDLIMVPHMVFKFFAELQVGQNAYTNGWTAYTAYNLSVTNTTRFDEGHAADHNYKEEVKKDRKEELAFTDGGDLPW